MTAPWVAGFFAAGWRLLAGTATEAMTSSVPSVLAWQRVVLRCAVRHRDWTPRAQAAAPDQGKLLPRLATWSSVYITTRLAMEPGLLRSPSQRHRRTARQAWRRHR